MDIEKTIHSLKKNNYEVSYFESGKEAAQYLDKNIDRKTVGFGDSKTIAKIGIYEKLSKHNEVYDPCQGNGHDEFHVIARKCFDTQIYLTSVNAMSQTGEMVNIDGTGNRISGSLYGHEKVYFVVSTNKIEETLEKAIWRARNIAGPKNAAKYNLNTPCVRLGGGCHDCNSPERICNSMNIYLKKMNYAEAEVILINEELGF